MLRCSMLRRSMGPGASYVNNVFDTVAKRYDLMNDLLSLGIHRRWKQHFVNDYVRPCPGGKFLDVAGGTGDIAFRIIDGVRLKEEVFGLVPTLRYLTEVVVLDANENMIREGEARAAREGYLDVKWVIGKGEELPFDDMSFDSYTVSFGIRNFSDRPKALREAYRVLKVGGVLNVLEFSKVTCPFLSLPYDVWSYGFIPMAGQILVERESYQYLVDSIRAFPDQEEFAKMISDAGFGYVRYENLTGGIACIHTAVKTEAVRVQPEKSPLESVATKAKEEKNSVDDEQLNPA
ncbi:putative ubiquinone biosynthesis methyltransferase [Trypanosoma cruzi]|uniref:2-methoxy-6-polyprenyl-1,4-benzoquinol methylase, mitochondrial n=2 Tax=Trypanosoma cruzi TaxID=5693 RepID=Q4DIT2_TRYCC|nr:ubiquinone biosynthesis methyltransferase, putative [Trypanosoma cruzi]EAN92428.1 ubiquinone biosynthesis methyltransferase, putative [Trypanosoma cruzi]PWU97617.1 putative ubiquinone biosynthesis methyltransferase [Trypanosoma cruzi]|eukprot:XP_814279.1 ubiquinone biosynthesis methyltransferase [Trypanosoma cruzi strain CL Brener]